MKKEESLWYNSKTNMKGLDAVAKTEEKDRLSTVLVVLLILFVLLLIAIIGFLALRFFLGRGSDRFDAAEYAAFCDSRPSQCPPVVPAEEAGGRYLNTGELLRLSGTVARVGDNQIELEGGITCHINPEALSQFEQGKLPEILESLQPGDQIRIGGMVRDTDPLALKYCGLPRDISGGVLYDGANPDNPAPEAGDASTQEPQAGSGQLSPLLYQVLSREATFYNCGWPGYNYETPNTLEYETCDVVTGGFGEGRYTTQDFAIIDIFQDGVSEVVLRGASANGESQYTVLHEDTDNGIVIGHVFGSPTDDTFFKTNGYHGAESANGDFIIDSYVFGDYAAQGFSPGDADYGYGGQSTEAEIFNGQYFPGMAGIDDPVSQEEYEAHLQEIGWYETEDAVFYDYTDANIARFAP